MAQDLNRKLVVEGLLKVEKSGFSNLVLPSLLSDTRLSNQDKAFISNLFYGTIERKITLNYILSRFISKPLKKLDKEVVARIPCRLLRQLTRLSGCALPSKRPAPRAWLMLF